MMSGTSMRMSMCTVHMYRKTLIYIYLLGRLLLFRLVHTWMGTMADLNNVSFTGRCTRDAVYKEVASGLCEFAIAVNGMKPDDTFFIDCNLWGKTAQNMCQYLLKGKQVGITGNLRRSKWVDKQGEEHEKWAVNTNSVTLLGAAQDTNDSHRGTLAPTDEERKKWFGDIPF